MIENFYKNHKGRIDGTKIKIDDLSAEVTETLHTSLYNEYGTYYGTDTVVTIVWKGLPTNDQKHLAQALCERESGWKPSDNVWDQKLLSYKHVVEWERREKCQL